MPTPRSSFIAAVAFCTAAALAVLIASGTGCALIVSYDGLVGDGGVGGKGTGGGSSSTSGSNGDGGSVGCEPKDCLAHPPQGWQGPVAFFSGPSVETLPSCAGLSLDLGSGSLDAPPAVCTACGCEAPKGQTCGDGVLTAYPSAGCTGLSSNSITPPGSGCQTLESMTGNDYFSSAPVLANGGSCKATGGKATLPSAHFAERIRLCASTSAGCASGTSCFPAPPPPYHSSACIYRMGDVACDVAGFSVKHSAHAGVDDSRACDSCNCDPPLGGTCPATTELYDLPGCVTLLNTAHHDDACVDAGGTESFLFTITGPAAGAKCAASGGQPIGSAMPGSTFTVCCGG